MQIFDLNNKILYDLSYDYYYIIDYNNDIQKFKNLDLKERYIYAN